MIEGFFVLAKPTGMNHSQGGKEPIRCLLFRKFCIILSDRPALVNGLQAHDQGVSFGWIFQIGVCRAALGGEFARTERWSTMVFAPGLRSSSSPAPRCSLRCASQFAMVVCRKASNSLAHWARSPLNAPQARGSFALRSSRRRGKFGGGLRPRPIGACGPQTPGAASKLCQSDPVGCRAEPCSVWAKPTSIYLPPSPRRAEKGGRGGRGGTQRSIQRCMSAGET